MRNINVVIDKMLAQVPDTGQWRYFIADLESIQSSVAFAAPEMTTFWWEVLSVSISEHLGPFADKLNLWQNLVVDILQDKT